MDVYRKAEYAKQILENPVFAEIISKIEQDIILKWKGSIVKGSEYREELFKEYEALLRINKVINGIINDAIYAKQKEESEREALR